MTIILSCSCKSVFQDREYGKGKRVHNEMNPIRKGEIRLKNQSKFRCTVCGKEKTK